MPRSPIAAEIRRVLNQFDVVLESITMRKISAQPTSSQELGRKIGDLRGKTILMSGGSRGIGLEIAKRCAQDGANLVIAAKSTQEHPNLPGTIYSACEEVRAAGGKSLPVVMDVREESQVQAAVDAAVKAFGGIDIVVNNASAIHLADTENTPAKKFDLMFDINVRGTFLLTQAALPHLRKASNPHILTLAPPIDLDGRWFKAHGSYTTSKYAMAMIARSFAEEMRAYGIASNCLWPRTTIATAAILNMSGGKMLGNSSRKPAIMADAAYEILCRDAKTTTGQSFIDDAVLLACGVTDFEQYSVKPGSKLQPDLFL